MKKSKDIPLFELVLRKYEKPYDVGKRESIRKLCLSMGLLQPGDSRDVIVDVLMVLMDARQEERKLTSEEVRELVIINRNEKMLPLIGIASSNIRRQLKRLRDIYLAEKVRNKYRITEFDLLERIYEEKIEKFLLSSIQQRIKTYLKLADSKF